MTSLEDRHETLMKAIALGKAEQNPLFYLYIAVRWLNKSEQLELFEQALIEWFVARKD